MSGYSGARAVVLGDDFLVGAGGPTMGCRDAFYGLSG